MILPFPDPIENAVEKPKSSRHNTRLCQCHPPSSYITTMTLRSEGTFLHHLLPQRVLVVGNRARPLLDRLVLAHHNILCDLVEKPEVVRNDDDATVEGVDGVGKGVDGWDVETVRRLVLYVVISVVADMYEACDDLRATACSGSQ